MRIWEARWRVLVGVLLVALGTSCVSDDAQKLAIQVRKNQETLAHAHRLTLDKLAETPGIISEACRARAAADVASFQASVESSQARLRANFQRGALDLLTVKFPKAFGDAVKPLQERGENEEKEFERLAAIAKGSSGDAGAAAEALDAQVTVLRTQALVDTTEGELREALVAGIAKSRSTSFLEIDGMPAQLGPHVAKLNGECAARLTPPAPAAPSGGGATSAPSSAAGDDSSAVQPAADSSPSKSTDLAGHRDAIEKLNAAQAAALLQLEFWINKPSAPSLVAQGAFSAFRKRVGGFIPSFGGLRDKAFDALQKKGLEELGNLEKKLGGKIQSRLSGLLADISKKADERTKAALVGTEGAKE